MIGSGGEEWFMLTSEASSLGFKEEDLVVLKQAQQNIQTYRQREVVLQLYDAEGNLFPPAEAVVEQTSSPFLWGHELWELDRRVRYHQEKDDDTFALCSMLKSCFTAATALHYWTERPRHDGPKSEEFQGYPKYDALEWCVNWARSEGLVVKGHPLFWTVPKAIPRWLTRYDYHTQLRFLEVRIRTITSRFREKIQIYDAVNEPIWEPTLRNLSQRHWPYIEDIKLMAEEIGLVLDWAREEDPYACYLINEYGIRAKDYTPIEITASNGEKVSAHSQLERFIQLIHELQARGKAPDAIGLQSHTGGWETPSQQWTTYDFLWAQTGLPIHITEFWAYPKEVKNDQLTPEEKEKEVARYILQFMTCAFGHPHIHAFFFWGMIPSLIQFNNEKGWELTPLYHRLTSQIRQVWRTNLVQHLDSQGVLRWRGFVGNYSIKIRFPNQSSYSFTFSVPSGKGIHQTDIMLPIRVEK